MGEKAPTLGLKPALMVGLEMRGREHKLQPSPGLRLPVSHQKQLEGAPSHPQSVNLQGLRETCSFSVQLKSHKITSV